MKYTELSRIFETKRDECREYSVMLVDLDRVDGDDVDVVLAPPGALEVDTDTHQIRLYSAAVRPITDGQPLAIFGIFIEAWPMKGVLEDDYTVMVQLPVAPEESPGPTTLVPLGGIRVAPESEEVWLLVHPESEYPPDVLPK